MVQCSNGHILFGLSSGPKATVDQSRKGPKKSPVHTAGHCFVTCVGACVCVYAVFSTGWKAVFDQSQTIITEEVRWKQLGESEMTSEKKKLRTERKKNCEKEEERGYQRKRGQELKEVKDK